MTENDSPYSPRPFTREDLAYLVRVQDKPPMDESSVRKTFMNSDRGPNYQGTADRTTMLDKLIAENEILARENEVLRRYLLLQKENSGLKTMDIITNAMGMYDETLKAFKMKLHTFAGELTNTAAGKQSINNAVSGRSTQTFGSQQAAQTQSYGASFPKVRFSELESSDDSNVPTLSFGQRSRDDSYVFQRDRSRDQPDGGNHEASTSYNQSFRELDIDDLRSPHSGSVNMANSEEDRIRQFYLSKSKTPVFSGSQIRRSPRASSAPAQISYRSPRPKSPVPLPKQRSPKGPSGLRSSMVSPRMSPRNPGQARSVNGYQADMENKRPTDTESLYRSRLSACTSPVKPTGNTSKETSYYDSLAQTEEMRRTERNRGVDSANSENCDTWTGCKMAKKLAPATGNGGISFRPPSPLYVNAVKHSEPGFVTATKSVNTDYLRSKSPTEQRKSVSFTRETSTMQRSSGRDIGGRLDVAPTQRHSPRTNSPAGNGRGYDMSPRKHGMIGVGSTMRNQTHADPNFLNRSSPRPMNQTRGPLVNRSPVVMGESKNDDSIWVNITTRAKVVNESQDKQRRASQENNKAYYNAVVERQTNGDEKEMYRSTVVENEREGDGNAYYHTTIERKMDGDDKKSYHKTTIDRQFDGDEKSVFRQSTIDKQKDGDSNRYHRMFVEQQDEGEDNRSYRKVVVGKQNEKDRNVYHRTAIERQEDGEDNQVYRKTQVEKRNEGNDNRVYRRTVVEKQKEGDKTAYHQSTVERQNEGDDLNVYRRSIVERQREGDDRSVNRVVTIERHNDGDENKMYRKTVLERQREADDDRVYQKTVLERQNDRDDNKMYRKTVIERQKEGDDSEMYHHSSVERQSVVTDPAVVGFQPIGPPLLTSTQVNSYRSTDNRQGLDQRKLSSPLPNKSFEAKVKQFAALAERQSPVSGASLNPMSQAKQSEIRRSLFNKTGQSRGSPATAAPHARIAATSDSIGNKREFDKSLVEAVFDNAPEPSASEKVKSVLYRPVDTLTGYRPRVTKELADMVLNANPCRRLVGEIAFQLDRRIMEFVFGPRRNSDGKKTQRSRYYGYSLVNIRQLIKKEASVIGLSIPERAERVEQELLRKLNNIITILEPMGYDFNVHPEFTQDVVNKYGLLKEAPDPNTLEGFGLGEPVVLRMILGRVIGSGAVLENSLVLLDSLCYLSYTDKTPLFMW